MFSSIINLLFPTKTKENNTAQDFINIKELQEDMIINSNGDAVMMIGLEPIPRELLSEREQALQATKIISELNSEIAPYRLIKVPGAVDISKITNALLDLKPDASEKRKMLINDEVSYLDKISTENQSLTPQFYLSIWDKDAELLKRRAFELADKYRKAGINAKVLTMKEIVYVLTLYTDPIAASAEQDLGDAVSAIRAPIMQFTNNDGLERWQW